MANGSCSNKSLFSSGPVSVTGTGQIGDKLSLESNADEIGIQITIGGSVAALTINLQHLVGNTWVNVAGAQTTATSGDAIAFATVPTTGVYRLNAATVTTPSSLQIIGALVYSKKYD